MKSDYFSDADLNLSILSVIGIIIFLFIYLTKKIILNSKREELEFSAIEAIILYIGTMPIIYLIPFIRDILFLLLGGF
jgi:hypothetical protein